MKRLEMPRNIFLKFLINFVFIVGWQIFYAYIDTYHFSNTDWYAFYRSVKIGNLIVIPFMIVFMPIFYVSRYIWYGRFKLGPRITRSKD